MSKCEASQGKRDIPDSPEAEVSVPPLINQYSFLAILAGFALVAALILLTNKPKWNDVLAYGAILAGLIAAWSVLHPRQTPLMDNAKMVQEMIGAGKPVLLEFQSPY